MLATGVAGGNGNAGMCNGSAAYAMSTCALRILAGCSKCYRPPDNAAIERADDLAKDRKVVAKEIVVMKQTEKSVTSTTQGTLDASVPETSPPKNEITMTIRPIQGASFGHRRPLFPSLSLVLFPSHRL